MPEQPPKRPGIIWPLSSAHDVGQVLRVTCGWCPGKRHYLPSDLQQLLGDIAVHAVAAKMTCERCGRRDAMSAYAFIPVASERQRLRIRRLVKIKVKQVPVWRDE